MTGPRYTVIKEQDFSAAHFLREYHGKCEQLHGHNYRVRVHVGADELDSEGLVVDLVALKAAMREVLDPLDHTCLNELAMFAELNPSLEHLARYIAEEVATRIDDERARVIRCEVWETDRNCAVYRR